jgi:hypothetical protein
VTAVPSTKKRGEKAKTAASDDAPPLPPPAKNDWRKQEYTVVPIDSISPRSEDEDANRGDKDAIGESIDENGVFGAILVRKADRKIIAGKTRWGQLKARGEDECPVIFLDVEPERADAINIADNRTRDHAKTNERVLADQVARIQVRSPDLRGLGIRPPDVSSLLEKALPRVGYLDNLMREDAEDDAEGSDGDGPADEEHDSTDFDDDGDPEGSSGSDEGPEEAEASEADVPEFERQEQPRHPLPIVLTNAQMRRWTEYKKRIGEKKDQAAFLVLLAAAMNEDDPAAL